MTSHNIFQSDYTTEDNKKYILSLTGRDPMCEEFTSYWEDLRDGYLEEEEGRLLTEEEYEALRDNEPTTLIHLLIEYGSANRVEVVTYGRGTPIVFISGLGVTAPVWSYQLRDLSTKYQVIIIHKPGHGHSDGLDEVTIDNVARSITKTLYCMRLNKRPHIVGTCLGGLVAQTMAINYPKGYASLTLVNSVYELKIEGFNADKLDRDGVKAVLKYTKAYTNNIARDFDNMVEINKVCAKLDDIKRSHEVQLKSRNISPIIYPQYVEDILKKGVSSRKILKHIKTATLVIAGDSDLVVDIEDSRKLYRDIANARYHEISKAGHFPYLTHYNEFNETLTAFVEKNIEQNENDLI